MTWKQFKAIRVALDERMWRSKHQTEIECLRSIDEAAFDYWNDCAKTLVYVYRIGKDVRPYPGKLLANYSGGSGNKGQLWGVVRLSLTNHSKEICYGESELTFVRTEPNDRLKSA